MVNQYSVLLIDHFSTKQVCCIHIFDLIPDLVFGLDAYGIVSSTGEKLPIRSNISKTIVVSRSHAGSVEQLAANVFGTDYVVEPAGGAGYKTLRLLNGTARLYMHQTKIKKWDTCAGDALMRAAGGAMIDMDGERIDYGGGRLLSMVNERGLLAALNGPYTYFRKIKASLDADGKKDNI